MKTVSIDVIKNLAKSLIDDGTNVEYCRGICELIADCDGITDVEHADRSIQIAQELGLSEYAAKALYAKPIIGYQIESKDGKHCIPDEFYSFEVLTENVANFWMENFDDGTWMKVSVREGDIEEPKIVEYL
jgi:hypothetical protein